MMMMGRTLLRVFCLSGWLIFSSGLYHDYHFVNTSMTWGQAQTYCRTTYTDLATIENITEMNQVISISSGSNSQVWIGLYAGVSWLWTDQITSSFWDWQNQTRNDPLFPYYFCYSLSNNGGGQVENCSLEHPFVCANGTLLIFVNQSMDWFRAWRYCKENFTDLTTIYYRYYNYYNYSKDVGNLVPPGDRAWVGFIGHNQMSWSDGSSSSFRYWDNVTYTFDSAWSGLRAAVDLQRSGKWRLLPDSTTLPFVCYGSLKVSPTTQRVFRLRISSSVDLNDPVVSDSILKQLQDRLKEKGVSGVTLRWTKQPDGKIFHKEENPTDTNGGC